MRSGGKGMWCRGPALYKHNYYYDGKLYFLFYQCICLQTFLLFGHLETLFTPGLTQFDFYLTCHHEENFFPSSNITQTFL